ncbi:hypothetical protein D3C75_1049360 [compost metagenome]
MFGLHDPYFANRLIPVSNIYRHTSILAVTRFKKIIGQSVINIFLLHFWLGENQFVVIVEHHDAKIVIGIKQLLPAAYDRIQIRWYLKLMILHGYSISDLPSE